MRLVGTGDLWTALASQMALGICRCVYRASLCAFLVRIFLQVSWLTSAAIGYNTAMVIAGFVQWLQEQKLQWMVLTEQAISWSMMPSMFFCR